MTTPDTEPTTETPKDKVLRWWFERGIAVGKAGAQAQVEALEAENERLLKTLRIQYDALRDLPSDVNPEDLGDA